MIAGLLSGVMPGLGQFYSRQWARGAMYLGAFSVADYSVGVSQGLFEFLMNRASPENVATLVMGSLFMMVVAAASVIDAVRTARDSSS
jgi:hypothetical protein